MKKYLLVILSIFIVGCSVSTESKNPSKVHPDQALVNKNIQTVDPTKSAYSSFITTTTKLSPEQQFVQTAENQFLKDSLKNMNKYVSSNDPRIHYYLYMSQSIDDYTLIKLVFKQSDPTQIVNATLAQGKLTIKNGSEFTIEDLKKQTVSLKNGYNNVYILKDSTAYNYSLSTERWNNIYILQTWYYLANDSVQDQLKWIQVLNLNPTQKVLTLLEGDINDENPFFTYFTKGDI